MRNSMSKAIIFGTENFAQMLLSYLQEIKVDVQAFCVDDNYVKERFFCRKEVVAFSDLAERFPPEQYDIYIAIGYTRMGHLRQEIAKKVQRLGYSTPNYVHPSAYISDSSRIIGTGNIVMERAIIGAMSTIGEGNLIWAGANIGHNASVGNWNTMSLSAVLCGFSTVEDYCFCGANSCVRDSCIIARETLVGANAYISHDTKPGQVFAASQPCLLQRRSLDIKL